MFNRNNTSTPPQATTETPSKDSSPTQPQTQQAKRDVNVNKMDTNPNVANETAQDKDLRLKAEAQTHRDEANALDKRPPQVHIMEFLQTISQKIKASEPRHYSVADDIDNYIRDHGNRFPETTKRNRNDLRARDFDTPTSPSVKPVK